MGNDSVFENGFGFFFFAGGYICVVNGFFPYRITKQGKASFSVGGGEILLSK